MLEKPPLQAVAPSMPPVYLITPEPEQTLKHFIASLEQSLIAGIGLVQLRAKTLDAATYRALAIDTLACCRQYGARLLLNADADLVDAIGADGVHVNGTRLAAYQTRPLATDKLVCAACHTLQQLQQAEKLAASFVTLSPVLPTASHPQAEALGWANFATMAAQTSLPVFALGGMNRALLATAQQHGGCGVAGIRAFWGA